MNMVVSVVGVRRISVWSLDVQENCIFAWVVIGRVQWCCKIGRGNEDSLARVKIKASSCQHGRWIEVSE